MCENGTLIGYEVKQEWWAYTQRNTPPQCCSFLKIAVLKASSLNMHECFPSIAFASKETLSGKQQLLHQKHSVAIRHRQGHHSGDRVVRQRAAYLYALAIYTTSQDTGSVQCNQDVEPWQSSQLPKKALKMWTSANIRTTGTRSKSHGLARLALC